MKRLACSAVLAISVVALSAQAQTMKPGLWEMTNKMGGSPEMDKAMAEAQKAMASLPAEQRKMMQDMMAKQGVQVGTNSAGAMSVKMCMTKDMIDNNDFAPQQGDCKTTTSPRVGNTIKMTFVCTKPPSSGEGQYTMSGSDAFSSRMVVNSTTNGKTDKMTMEGQGKWLSAECGDVKPPSRPKK